MIEELRQKYPNIKARTKNNIGVQPWNLDNLKDGLQYFFDLNKHYPSVPEVDRFEYLPTARSIQRSFGGMVGLRQLLKLDGPENFSKGKVRSEVALKLWNKARNYEEKFYNFLLTKIPEVRIHEHRIIRPGRVSCDFFIYNSENTGVVIDLFYAQDIINLSKVVNIKHKRYKSLPYIIYFILVENPNIFVEQIELLIGKRKNKLDSNIYVLTEQEFKANLNRYINRQLGDDAKA